MTKLKHLFRTRYRIVTDAYNGYECQYKDWWFPFWEQILVNSNTSVEEAEEWLKSKGYELKFDTGSDIMVLALRNENQKRIVVTATTNSNLTEAAAECCLEVMRREGK